jgi:hypothetical protein
MIEGFKLDFSSEELKAHLEERVAHHAQKETGYRQQAKGVHAVKGEDFQGQTVDPEHALSQQANTHANKREFFKVLAEHIIPNETYRLKQEDLVLIELVSRGW